MSEKKAIIFDFFGVLHDDPQGSLREQHPHAKGAFASADHLLDTGQIGYDDYVQKYAHEVGKSPEELAKLFADATVMEDTRLLLAELQASGHPTGLLTNTSLAEVTPLLDRHSLPELFDHVVISGEVGMRKPEPGIYKLMLGRLAIPPEQAIFIDDNPDNVAAAQSLGMTGLCFTDCTTLRDDLIGLGIQPAPLARAGTAMSF